MNYVRQEHTNTRKPATRKPKNALWLLPAGMFVVVSTFPHNALAFESNLPNSPAQKLVADVRVARDGNQSGYTQSAVRTQAIVVAASPVTQSGNWPIPPKSVTQAPKIAAPRVFPTLDTPVVLEGEASYYSRAGCLGCDPQMIMANGQPLNDNALTMAIGADRKHLVGRQAKVTSLATGQSVVARITDTGGFYQAKYGHRVADLTVATKQAIGMKGGVGQVRVEVY